MIDEDNIISSDRRSFIRRDDCGFEERVINFVYNPKDVWDGHIRAYRPEVEKMREYRMPQLKRVN